MKNDSDSPASDRGVDPLDKLLRMARWPNDGSDPLDKLLHMAQWPDLPEGSLPHWRQQMARWQSRRATERVCEKPQIDPALARRKEGQREKRRKAWAIASGVVVAAFLLATGLWSKRFSNDKTTADVPTQVVQNRTPEAAEPAATEDGRDCRSATVRETFPEAVVSQQTVAATNSPLFSRAMPHEELYQRMFHNRNQVWALPEDEDSIDRIVAQRIAEPDGDLQELVQPLLAERAEYEQRLLERLRTFNRERISAAIELLGCVGSEASVPLVLRWSLDPATHAPAVRALLNIADTRMLARLALNEPDPELREEITGALRARGDKQTLFFVLAVQGEYSCLESGSDLWQPVE